MRNPTVASVMTRNPCTLLSDKEIGAVPVVCQHHQEVLETAMLTSELAGACLPRPGDRWAALPTST
ncbi:hypothetical protein [Kibdelosporangium aridum]|uniref:Uncharacterized protein n=1 Tax=Kibdelosporangium aridum TaxID=2030 RepID=A0A1Y5Y983_KIBAR|nr:hypothetical protein [Kibdelosporangium aridum]SMD27136.1 hypothetical protein SAMN05661093_10733 [Kibdelosporangium aridum]